MPLFKVFDNIIIMKATSPLSSMNAICKCIDGSVKVIELSLFNISKPVDIYDICEHELGVRVENVENLEDIMIEVQYMSEFFE